MNKLPDQLLEVKKFWEGRFADGWTEQKNPIPVIPVRHPFYEHTCECGFTGSSEIYLECRNWDDGSMMCPRCLKDH